MAASMGLRGRAPGSARRTKVEAHRIVSSRETFQILSGLILAGHYERVSKETHTATSKTVPKSTTRKECTKHSGRIHEAADEELQ